MKRILTMAATVLFLSATAGAQVPGLTGPIAPSPPASVSQTIGLTTISVSYHRPAVNDRAIWGALVPHDQVWRAGANQNTTVTFSTPVTVNGTRLDAGTYGLHMIPTQGDWTIAFSNESGAWGSFTYDQAEDAARVTAKPEAAPFQERLGYSFDDPTTDSVTLALRWEKLRVPVEVKIDLGRTVLDSYKAQLRGLPQFGWQGWNQAAAWAVQYDLELDNALTWADRSISIARNYTNLNTKATVLRNQGKAAEADTLVAEALRIANENELNTYGYQLLGQQNVDDAIEIFARNVREHPESWNTYDSLAEAYATKGDKQKAIENYTKALNMTTLAPQKTRIQGALEQLKDK